MKLDNEKICYVCGKLIRPSDFKIGKAISIGQNKYRHHKCRYKLVRDMMKSQRRIWLINPKTKIKPNKKKKTRSQNKEDLRKKLKEDL